MMEKYFANYNQALALKELGFDESCFGYYDGWNGQTHLIVSDEGNTRFLVRLFNLFRKKETQTYNQDYVEYLTGICTAPLKLQVFDWFRIKYKYYFWIEPCSQHKIFHFNITCSPSSFTYCTIDETKPNAGGFKSYEEAESACIDKLIEIVKG